MAQSVKCPTLDFSSGHDLMVNEIEPPPPPTSDSVLTTWSLLGILSFPFSVPPLHACGLSPPLKINKKQTKPKPVKVVCPGVEELMGKSRSGSGSLINPDYQGWALPGPKRGCGCDWLSSVG